MIGIDQAGMRGGLDDWAAEEKPGPICLDGPVNRMEFVSENAGRFGGGRTMVRSTEKGTPEEGGR